MARNESSFSKKDSNIIYPEVFNLSRTSGLVVTLKPNALPTYGVGDFYYDVPSIVSISSSGATLAAAVVSTINGINTYKTTNPTLDIKIIRTQFVQPSAGSYFYTVVVSVFRT